MRTIEIWYKIETIGILFTAEIPGIPLQDYSLKRAVEVLTNIYGAPMLTQTADGEYKVMKWKGGEA